MFDVLLFCFHLSILSVSVLAVLCDGVPSTAHSSYPHAFMLFFFFFLSDGDIVNASVRPSVRPSCYLLNRWTEFYQICYNTSPHGKGVREQHFFRAYVRPYVHPSICRSCYLFLNYCMVGTEPNSLHYPSTHYKNDPSPS